MNDPKKVEAADLLNTNLRKLKFVFVFSAMLFGAIVGICLLVAYFQNQFPENDLLVKIIIGAILIFPLLICVISILDWKLKAIKSKKLYQKIADDLSRFNFEPTIIDRDTKWRFAQSGFKTEIGDRDLYLTTDFKAANPIKLTIDTSEKYDSVTISIAEFSQMQTRDLLHLFK